MADFTLLRPWWLIMLLLPLMFVYIDFAKHYKLQNFINEDIINYLKPKKISKKDVVEDEDEDVDSIGEAVTTEEQKILISKPKLWKKFGWLMIPYFFGVFALSGPAVSQDSELFQSDENWVWVVDTSLSMLAKDLNPNQSRFQLARFSLIELLHASKSHRHISLVAFTNHSYVVSPPTDDSTTLLYMLQELDPSIMPREGQGSDPIEGLTEAVKILDQDNKTPGNILLVIDSISEDIDEIARLTEFINNCQYPVYIYAIGTPGGSPIQIDNSYVRDKNGNTVMARTNFEPIHKLAKDTGSKVYFEMDNEAPHLEQMYSYRHPKYKVTDKSKHTHKDIGYYFMIICLVTAVCFVRNYFFVIALAFTITASAMLSPTEAWADDDDVDPKYINSHPNEYGYDLFQKGEVERENKNYDKAKEYYEKSLVHLKDHFWRGNANYRLGKYAEAASEYGKLGNNAEAKYNIGNCFVNMYDPEVPSSSLDDAILAYDQALELDPNHADASMNKTVIIEFLRKKREAERAEQEARAKENNLTGTTSGSSGYLGLQNSLSGTTLLQRRMILQQSKKNYKTTEQKW